MCNKVYCNYLFTPDANGFWKLTSCYDPATDKTLGVTEFPSLSDFLSRFDINLPYDCYYLFLRTDGYDIKLSRSDNKINIFITYY